jgi:hypothetical protein
MGGPLEAEAGDGHQPVRPPGNVLWVAGAAPVIAAALLAVGGVFVHLIGYAVTILVGLCSLAVFYRLDAERRRAKTYTPVPALRRVVVGLGIACLAVAMVHVWFVATWVATRA